MKRAIARIRTPSPSLEQRLDAWHRREQHLLREIERISGGVRDLNARGDAMEWREWVRYQQLQPGMDIRNARENLRPLRQPWKR